MSAIPVPFCIILPSLARISSFRKSSWFLESYSWFMASSLSSCSSLYVTLSGAFFIVVVIKWGSLHIALRHSAYHINKYQVNVSCCCLRFPTLPTHKLFTPIHVSLLLLTLPTLSLMRAQVASASSSVSRCGVLTIMVDRAVAVAGTPGCPVRWGPMPWALTYCSMRS